MTYRDDRDALLARSEALERQLAEAREESQEKTTRLEAERDELMRKLERLRRGESEDEPEPEPLSSLSTTAGTTLPENEGFLARTWEWLKEGSVGLFGIILVGGVPILIVLIPMALYESCVEKTLDREATLLWRATVASSRDQAIAPAAACEIRAVVRGDGEERFAVDSLIVTCGEQQIYNWNDSYRSLSGDDAPSPRRECEELTQTEQGERTTFGLRCVDVEGRSGGRAEMSLDTARGQAAVWRDTPPILRVELDVEPASEPLQPARPLIGGSSTQGFWDGC